MEAKILKTIKGEQPVNRSGVFDPANIILTAAVVRAFNSCRAIRGRLLNVLLLYSTRSGGGSIAENSSTKRRAYSSSSSVTRSRRGERTTSPT